jgi:hypothetical protein
MIGELAANLVLDLAQRSACGDGIEVSPALFQRCNTQIVPAFFNCEIVSAE